jgi:hypothetical protein
MAGRKVIDLLGHRSGKLTVVGFAGWSNHGNARWYCRCDCGNSTEVDSNHLRRQKTQSCGCLRRMTKYDAMAAE